MSFKRHGHRMMRALLILLLWAPAGWLTAGTLLLSPAPSTLSEQFADALGRQGRAITAQYLQQPPDTTALAEADLVITLGQAALKWRMQQAPSTPTLAIYLNLDSLHTLALTDADQRPDWLQLMTISPLPDRQLQLAAIGVPRLRRLGLLYSPSQDWQLPLWQAAAERQQLQLVTRRLDHPAQLARQLADLLPRTDALIGIEDSAVYAPELIKTILLTSYNHNRVLIGPSAPYIAAGSLASTYSDPEAVAADVSALLAQEWQPRTLHFPRRFSVISNRQVARSLGLDLPADDDLQQRLVQAEMP